MKKENFSAPLDLKNVKITDNFWFREMELVRKEVIPYQWDALNDRIPDAAPSYCMHNFRVAGKMMKEKRDSGASYVPPAYSYRGFNAVPPNPREPDDEHFYGFVFQDTDFSKWIEAVAYSLTWHKDEKLMQIADEAIDVVCAAQHDSGYLDTYYIINGMDKAFTELKDHHELYCLGHLVEGAVAYYQATGKNKLLKAACRFADYVDSIFGTQDGKKKGYPGHEIAEMALVRLYEVTGEKKYLDLSRYFILERGKQPYYFDTEEFDFGGVPKQKNNDPNRYVYYQAHKPVYEQDEAVGHAVRAGYLYCGMADVARLTQDEKLYDSCVRLWNSIVKEKLYITGGMGGTKEGEAFSFPYDLPNDEAYSETCAAISLAFFARRMLEIEPKSEYGDVMELALYNTVLAGMALDGKSFFYVNPLSVFPEACHKDQRKWHVKSIRQKWFGCACCPPNIARIVTSIASYAYTQNDNTLFTHLYIGGEIKSVIEKQQVICTLSSDMPWNGNVSMKISCQDDFSYTFAFRIPKWTCKKTIKINIPQGISQKEENGYLYFQGKWKNTDEITLSFEMPVRMVKANDKVREDVNKVAFTRGPITYCLEQADNGENLHLVYVQQSDLYDKENGGILQDKVKVLEDDTLGHRLNKLVIPGKRQKNTDSQQNLYEDFVPQEVCNVDLVFVPYYAWNNRGEGEMDVFVAIK